MAASSTSGTPSLQRSGGRPREPLIGRVLSSRWTKAVVFVACLVPIFLLAWPVWILVTNGYSPELTANPIEYVTHYTGTWTIRFLLIALSITPLRKIFNQPKLARYRRMLGLFAFFYVCLHFLIWFVLDKFFSFPDMWADILKRPYITAGMAGFAMLIPLAVTSTAGWVRRMGYVKWQRLHRLAYFAALAGVIHYYWLVKSDVRLPLMYGAILGILMLYRLVTRRPVQRRAPARASAESRPTTPNTASLPD